MAETHPTASEEMEVEAHTPYMTVFFTLALLTVIEYFYAMVFTTSFTTLVIGLMFLAVIKAGLVGWFFMHLKFEGNWVYGMLVPAGILACVLVFALIPDIALHAAEENPADDEGISSTTISSPSSPGPLRSASTV